MEQDIEPTFLKRIEDTRSLDEKIYKVRVVVPNQFRGAKLQSLDLFFKSPAPQDLEQMLMLLEVLSVLQSKFGSNGDYDFDRNPDLLAHALDLVTQSL